MTSMTFPKMDGSSKDVAYFDLEWEAETVRWLRGDNSDLRRPIAPQQKAWLCSNFRFEMGGLPCNRVATIDSYTWTCAMVRDRIGETKRPAAVTVPNIIVEVSMADYDAWFQAAKKWFIDGHHEANDEMSGAIVFLGPDMKTEIGPLSIPNSPPAPTSLSLILFTGGINSVWIQTMSQVTFQMSAQRSCSA